MQRRFPSVQKPAAATCLAALFLSGSLPLPGRTSQEQFCGTHARSDIEQRYLRQRSQENRFLKTLSFASLATPRRAASEDVGNIAVIDDSNGVVTRRNPFNLENRTVSYYSSAGGAPYQIITGEDSFSSAMAEEGAALPLGDDDTRQVPLPFAFSYYGVTYDSVFVNSDGNLTFTAGDDASADRSLGRMTGGPPRISALFTDLDPTRPGGSVRVYSTAEVFAVTWQRVRLWDSSNSGQIQNFQLRLFPDARIEVTYVGMNMTGETAVAGISPGGLKGPIQLVALAGSPAGEFPATVADVFAGADEVDLAVATQRFYATHEDAYDFLVIFNALRIPTNNSGAIAFETTVRNVVDGVGDRIGDEGLYYGSRRRLQGLMYMGPWEQYPSDPFATMPLRVGTGETGIAVVGHEASHRFLAYVSVQDDSGRNIMFGRDAVHWGFNFNSEGSLTEGNRIVDNGPEANPRFFAAGAAERTSPLDQYFFGFRAPEEVPATFAVLNSTGPSNGSAPRPGTRFNGTRRDIDINEIIQAAGAPRTPDHQVAQRKYRFGWMVINRTGDPLPARALEVIERYRSEWEAYWSRVSEGLSTAEATLKRALDVSLFPHQELTAGETASASVRITNPLEVPLTIRLSNGNAEAAGLPETVVIPAGETSVSFRVDAKATGVTVITATPDREEFESVESRIRVR